MSKEKINDSELAAGHLRKNAMPFLYLMLGIAGGFLISLSANVINNLYGKSKTYQLIVLGVTAIFLIFLIRFFQAQWAKPIKNLENKK